MPSQPALQPYSHHWLSRIVSAMRGCGLRAAHANANRRMQCGGAVPSNVKVEAAVHVATCTHIKLRCTAVEELVETSA